MPAQAKERRERFLGRRPFLRKPAQEPEPGRPTPSAQHQERPNKHKTKTQTHRRTTKQKGKHPDSQESFLLAELPLFSPPFRRCCDRFLGRRPRHAAALGLSDQLRDTSQKELVKDSCAYLVTVESPDDTTYAYKFLRGSTSQTSPC